MNLLFFYSNLELINAKKKQGRIYKGRVYNDKEKILGLIVAVTLFTAVPAGISLSTARDVQAAETYTVNSPVSRFRDADSAATGEGSVGTYPTGTY